jgi:hypothetical protein
MAFKDWIRRALLVVDPTHYIYVACGRNEGRAGALRSVGARCWEKLHAACVKKTTYSVALSADTVDFVA